MQQLVEYDLFIGYLPFRTASTGRITPQTKAPFRPGTLTARQGLRPYFSAAASTAARTAASSRPRHSRARSLA